MPAHLPSCLAPPVDGTGWAPPLDLQDVVIRLEAAGVTDRVAQREYGCSDLWALAGECLTAQELPAVRKSLPRHNAFFEYLQGVSFAIPLLLCCLSMWRFDFSLWGGDVTANMAGAVGLGTVSSFVVTGGFVQLIARRSLFYLGIQDPATAAALCRRWVAYAAASLAISGVVLIALARAYQWLPAPYDWAAVAFHFTLGLLWIATGMLQMLDRNLWSAAATACGILVVIALHLLGGLALIPAQLSGIIAAECVAYAACIVLIRARSKTGNTVPRRPGVAVDLYHGWTFFLYGCLYYGLIFADRLLSWTVPDAGAPSAIQFRGDYETALDIALISFVVQVGLVPVLSAGFFRRLRVIEEQMPVHRRDDFLRQIKRVYNRSSAWLALWALAIALSLCAITWHAPYLEGKLVYWTLAAAVAGNSLLVMALWNASLLFRLSRPVDVVSSIAAAVLSDLVIGYVASRLGSYHFSVFGFVSGSLIFWLLTHRRIRQTMRAIDYYHFAADA